MYNLMMLFVNYKLINIINFCTQILLCCVIADNLDLLMYFIILQYLCQTYILLLPASYLTNLIINHDLIEKVAHTLLLKDYSLFNRLHPYLPLRKLKKGFLVVKFLKVGHYLLNV